jgi:hypothetical protein
MARINGNNRNGPGQNTIKWLCHASRAEINIPPIVATAIRMVQNGHDDTGPNPGYQRNLLRKRLDRLRNGFSEIQQKAKHLIPQSAILEMSEIEAVLNR